MPTNLSTADQKYLKETFKQLERAWQIAVSAPKSFHLIVVTGRAGSGKSTFMRYCTGSRYRLDPENPDVLSSEEMPKMDLISQGDFIFFNGAVSRAYHK